MSLLSDTTIRELCLNVTPDKRMIHPFSQFWPYTPQKFPTGQISYGLTHAGYDARLAEEILRFNPNAVDPDNPGQLLTIDPKRFHDERYREAAFIRTIYPPYAPVVLPPNGYILGMTVERFRIPNGVKMRCVGKSTLARSLIIINTTPGEAEWEGTLTLEIGNVGPLPAVVYVGEGIAQMEFEQTDKLSQFTYADKQGKYQNQKTVTPASVK